MVFLAHLVLVWVPARTHDGRRDVPSADLGFLQRFFVGAAHDVTGFTWVSILAGQAIFEEDRALSALRTINHVGHLIWQQVRRRAGTAHYLEADKGSHADRRGRRTTRPQAPVPDSRRTVAARVVARPQSVEYSARVSLLRTETVASAARPPPDTS